jgi:hypothetical protein
MFSDESFVSSVAVALPLASYEPIDESPDKNVDLRRVIGVLGDNPLHKVDSRVAQYAISALVGRVAVTVGAAIYLDHARPAPVRHEEIDLSGLSGDEDDGVSGNEDSVLGW